MAIRQSEDSSKVINLSERASSYKDVDDVVLEGTQKQGQTTEKVSKLKHANDVATKSTAEIRALVTGLNNKVAEIGMRVANAPSYQGREKLYAFMGNIGFSSVKEHADNMRHDRIQNMTMEAAVGEIKRYVDYCIVEIGKSEAEYKSKLKDVDSKLTIIIKKYKETDYLKQQS